MKTPDRKSVRAIKSSDSDRIRVKVSAAGRGDFQTSVSAATTSKQLKLQALTFFGLNLGEAEHYRLRYRDGDQPERQLISSLGLTEVQLTLVREEASGRFGERLFLPRAQR